MESIGERLKKIRLEKGIRLEDVHKKTRIHMNILKAIEGEGITNVDPIYLRGFTKLYCKFLGIDPKECIPDYKEPQGMLLADNSASAIDDFVSSPAPEKIEEKKPEEKRFEEKKFEERRFEKDPVALKGASMALKDASAAPGNTGMFVSIGVALVIVVAIFFGIGKAISSKKARQPAKKTAAVAKAEKQEEAKSQAAQAAATEASHAAVPAAATEQKKTASIPKNISGIRLIIKARENCWISLKADGRVVFQRVLERGRFEGWRAKEKIELSLGNAGAVELEVNGQRFTNLGRKGQSRKNIVITKEGLNIGG